MPGGDPVPLSDHVRLRLERQRVRDTKPELALRRALHRRGLRYRVDSRILSATRRRVDIAFAGPRLAVFVHGCFWHSCPLHGLSPKNNADWWRDKLERNRERDEETMRLLEAEGWTPLVVWEHEDLEEAADKIAALVRARH